MRLPATRTLLVAAVVLLPLAAAHAGAEMSSSQVAAQGDVSLDSRLVALARFDLAPPDFVGEAQMASVDPAFALDAVQVRVVSHEANVTANEARGRLAPLPYHHEATYVDVQLSGVQTRGGYRTEVFPSASGAHLSASLDCLSGKTSGANTFESARKVDSQAPTFPTDVSGSTQLSVCGTGTLTITGSFVLTLWQWDATLTTQGMTTRLPSGIDETDALPAPVAALGYPMVAKARQQYLYVDNGTLTLPMDASSHLLYVDDASMDVDGKVSLDNATGQLAEGSGIADVQGRRVDLDGHVGLAALHSQGQGRMLQAAVTGDYSGQVDGQPLAFTAAPVHTVLPPWTLAAAGAVLATPLLVPVRRFRRRRQSRGVARQCKALTDSTRFAEAIPLAERALDLDPRNGMAHFELARALEQVGQGERAAGHRAIADEILRDGVDPELWVENAFQAAEAAAVAGQQDVALHWLRKALAAKPALAADATVLPEVAALLERLQGPGRAAPALPEGVPYWMLP